MRTVQHGTGNHVVVTIMCGYVARDVARILGPSVTVYEIPASRETPTEAAELKELRDTTHGFGGELWLVGFSAGGGAVRRLLDVVDPHGCVIVDGGAVSLPGRPQTMPPSQYTRFFELAKLGVRQFIASHTFLTYVEQLPPAQGPYRSTVGTLRDLTGWELPEPEPGEFNVTSSPNGAIKVWSYESGPADPAAHVRQVREILPLIAQQYLRPRLLGSDAGRDAVAAVVAVAGSIRAAVISAAEQVADAVAGDGAAPVAVYHSHGWRCSVRELVEDARKCGRWHERQDVLDDRSYRPKIGDLVISKRAGGDPRFGGPGHVERVSDDGGEEYGPDVTIGGNEGNRWIEAPLDWSAVVGIIDVDPAIGRRAVELSRAELAAGVAEVPGPASNPQIQAYHAGARRGGSELAGMPGHEREGVAVLGSRASDEVAWCASAASWAAYAAAMEVAS